MAYAHGTDEKQNNKTRKPEIIDRKVVKVTGGHGHGHEQRKRAVFSFNFLASDKQKKGRKGISHTNIRTSR
ncbi:hypothetical protein OUZ56_008455 [Daphnia magna]|uniref:Uncharacterized protein n=1 Tax=Daphnia magna TaxID=35525 RepID=A0ABR0AD15_9CRUS|nr:hypothetical protein OUZ56_008455 [Daphnia magna]